MSIWLQWPYVESKNVLAIYKPQAKIVSNMIASVKNVRVVGITLHTAWFYVYLTMTFDSKAIRGIQKRTCHLQTSGKDCVKYDSIRQKCKSSWHYTPYSLILCIFDHDIWLQGHTWKTKTYLAIYKPQAKIVLNMITSVKNVRVVGITLHTAWFYVYLTMTFDSKAIRGIQKRTCRLQTSGKDCVKYDSIRQKCKSSWHYTPYSLILCIFDHGIWLRCHTWNPKTYLPSTNLRQRLCQIW